MLEGMLGFGAHKVGDTAFHLQLAYRGPDGAVHTERQVYSSTEPCSLSLYSFSVFTGQMPGNKSFFDFDPARAKESRQSWRAFAESALISEYLY